MYPAELVAPMKEELTSVGFDELTLPDQVDQVLGNNEGTVLVMVTQYVDVPLPMQDLQLQ